MVETAFNIFDVVVIVIVALSALLSFFRGFVKEILSLGAWMGASLITMYYFIDVAEMIQPQVKSSVVASGLAAMGTFIVALIIISIGNSILLKLFKQGKDVGLLDNVMGLCFGVLRACLLISLSYYVFSFAVAEDDMPPWVAEAKTRPYVEQGAHLVAKLAPDYLNEIIPMSDTVDKQENLNHQELIGDVLKQVRKLQLNTQNPDQPITDSSGETLKADELKALIEKTQQQLQEQLQQQQQQAAPQ